MTYSVETTLRDELEISDFDWNRTQLIEFGNYLAKIGVEKNLPLAVSILMEDVRIFQQFAEGTSEVNELWVQRKINTVRATGHSTLYVRAVMDKGSYSDLHLDNCMGELAICGGGIPIAKNGNTHAIVIVSGLPHEEDHNFIIRHFDTFRSNHGK